MVMQAASKHVYKVGDAARSCDINSSKAEDAKAVKAAVSTLREGDAAFIQRSDRTWRYAVVMKVTKTGSNPNIDFLVHQDGSTKKVGKCHWGTRVRTIDYEKCAELSKYEGDCPTADCSPFSSMTSADFAHVAQQQEPTSVESNDDKATSPPARGLPEDKQIRRSSSLKKTASLIFRNLMADNKEHSEGKSSSLRRCSGSRKASYLTDPGDGGEDAPLPGTKNANDAIPTSICASAEQPTKNEEFKPASIKPLPRRSTKNKTGLSASSTFKSAFAAIMADQRGVDLRRGNGQGSQRGSKTQGSDKAQRKPNDADYLDQYVPESERKMVDDRRGVLQSMTGTVRKSVRFLNTSFKKDNQQHEEVEVFDAVESKASEPENNFASQLEEAPVITSQNRRLSRKKSLDDASEIQSRMQKAMTVK